MVQKMSRDGNITLELVCAETKQPFTEHLGPNGETFVEVEPDMDYFVRVGTRNAAASGKAVLIYCKVDGVDVGVRKRISANANSLVGIFQRDGDKETMTALRFAKTMIHPTSHLADGTERLWTGEVQASFYEGVVDKHKTIRSDPYRSSWISGEVGATLGVTQPNQKKGVKSVEGGSKIVSRAAGGKSRVAYRRGEKLGEIKIKYCSAQGLILAGILAPPPRYSVPVNDDNSSTLSSGSNRPMKRTKLEKAEGGAKGKVPGSNFDLVDLTGED